MDILQPSVLVGFLCGLAVALAFHWFAPIGTDAVSAGAWFIGLGCLGGYLWSALANKFKD